MTGGSRCLSLAGERGVAHLPIMQHGRGRQWRCVGPHGPHGRPKRMTPLAVFVRDAPESEAHETDAGHVAHRLDQLLRHRVWVGQSLDGCADLMAGEGGQQIGSGHASHTGWVWPSNGNGTARGSDRETGDSLLSRG